MDVSGVLKKAWAAVNDAGLPVEVQAVAFREAVRLLAPESSAPGIARTHRGETRGVGGSASAGRPDVGSANGEMVPSASEDEVYERVVTQTGVDRHRLEQVVHLDGDALKVSIPGIKLGKNNAEKTRALAQILTIVRGFGLDEQDTSVEVVRTEAARLKCYDSANFAAHLGKLNGYVITGSGANRRIRAKAAGIQAFPALLESLLGDS
jgi:hypothetical protein